MGASSARHARDLLIPVGRSAEPIESYDLAESRLLVWWSGRFWGPRS
jgi:hypothetical protein